MKTCSDLGRKFSVVLVRKIVSFSLFVQRSIFPFERRLKGL